EVAIEDAGLKPGRYENVRKRAGKTPARFLWSGQLLRRAFLFVATVVRLRRRNVAALRVDNVAPGVLVVVLDPGHGERKAVFVAPFRSKIQEVVRTDKNVQSTGVGGIGMEDVPRFVFVEGA